MAVLFFNLAFLTVDVFPAILSFSVLVNLCVSISWYIARYPCFSVLFFCYLIWESWIFLSFCLFFVRNFFLSFFSMQPLGLASVWFRVFYSHDGLPTFGVFVCFLSFIFEISSPPPNFRVGLFFCLSALLISLTLRAVLIVFVGWLCPFWDLVIFCFCGVFLRLFFCYFVLFFGYFYLGFLEICYFWWQITLPT